MFTDPACLGHYENYYSSLGDVDDIAAIIVGSQMLQRNMTIIICDDTSDHMRYKSFMYLIGNKLNEIYSTQFIMESCLSKDHFNKYSIIHLHSPISSKTCKILQQSTISSPIYRQGDNNGYNFLNTSWTVEWLKHTPIKLICYDTISTSFTLTYDKLLYDTLIGPVRLIYSDYFAYEFNKQFGTALHVKSLCNRLYGDTGLNGTPGNGIVKYLPLILHLGLTEESIDRLLGVRLLDAFNSTIASDADPSTIYNGKCIIYILNCYCQYTNLIVNDKLPTISNLGIIRKRDDILPIIDLYMESFKKISSPLFDFTATVKSISSIDYHIEEMSPMLKHSIISINNKI
jgi:hypothetical protein